MAGKFRFTVTAKDPLESTLTFESNEIQIAFSVPTPAPATPTPPPEPTPDPTFSPATVPPITDPSVGTVPKTIQSILLPVLILSLIHILPTHSSLRMCCWRALGSRACLLRYAPAHMWK